MTDKTYNSIISNTQAADILDCIIGHKEKNYTANLLN